MLRSVRLCLSVSCPLTLAQNGAFQGYVYHRTLTIGNHALEVEPTGQQWPRRQRNKAVTGAAHDHIINNVS